MTVSEIKRGIAKLPDDAELYIDDGYIKAVDMPIELLKQQHCEDCIDRSKLGLTDFEIVMCDGDYKEALKMLLDKIEKAPSVYPKPKVGHNCNKDYADCDQFVCSECGIELQDWHKVVRDDEYDDISYQEYAFRFCPSCGCEMEDMK